jgi:hypothetical protein
MINEPRRQGGRKAPSSVRSVSLGATDEIVSKPGRRDCLVRQDRGWQHAGILTALVAVTLIVDQRAPAAG